MEDEPELSKTQAREYAYNGYRYAGYWDELYHYQKYVYTTYEPIDEKSSKINWGGYLNVALFAEDLINGNYKEMMEHNITRTKDSLKIEEE